VLPVGKRNHHAVINASIEKQRMILSKYAKKNTPEAGKPAARVPCRQAVPSQPPSQEVDLDLDPLEELTGSNMEHGEFLNSSEGTQVQAGIKMRHRLRQNLAAWATITTSVMILSWLAEGFPLKWKANPPAPVFLKNHQSAFNNADFVTSAIQGLLDSDTIMQSPTAPHVVCPLGVVTEPTKQRLIWDGRWVNSACVIPKFKYESLSQLHEWAVPMDFAFALDLKSGYHHVDMHPDSWKYLGFSWKGKHYFFTQLPFGLAPACWAFTKITRVVLNHFRGKGIRCTGYLDDSLWLSQCKASLQATQHAVLSLFSNLGLIVSMKKCQLDISHEVKYLGMLINLAIGKCKVPQAKKESLAALLSSARKFGDNFHVRDLAAIKGRLISMVFSFGVAAMLFSKSMDLDIAASPTWNSRISLHMDTRKELLFWESAVSMFDGWRPLWPMTGPRRVVHTDAAGPSVSSTGGWGAWYKLQNQEIARAHGSWDSLPLKWSSTGLELQAVLNALNAFNPNGELDSTQVQVVSDAKNVFYALMCGHSLAPNCIAIAQQVLLYTLAHDIHLAVTWVPRKLNQKADSLSKFVDRTDWQLNPQVFADLNAVWGPFEVDLFASSSTTQLPVFFSRFHTVGSRAVDGLSQTWEGLCWAYPPVSLVSKVLLHAQHQQAKVCLIIPHWKATAWWVRLAPTGVFFGAHVHGCIELPKDNLFCSFQPFQYKPPCPLLAILLDYRFPAKNLIRTPL
jgi:ribonuclease HI